MANANSNNKMMDLCSIVHGLSVDKEPSEAESRHFNASHDSNESSSAASCCFDLDASAAASAPIGAFATSHAEATQLEPQTRANSAPEELVSRLPSLRLSPDSEDERSSDEHTHGGALAQQLVQSRHSFAAGHSAEVSGSSSGGSAVHSGPSNGIQPLSAVLSTTSRRRPLERPAPVHPAVHLRPPPVPPAIVPPPQRGMSLSIGPPRVNVLRTGQHSAMATTATSAASAEQDPAAYHGGLDAAERDAAAVTFRTPALTAHEGAGLMSAPGNAAHAPASDTLTLRGDERIAVMGSTHSHRAKLNATTRQYGCDKCGRAFQRRSDYMRHFQIHLGIKPNQCPICGKAFIQRSAMTVHVRVHTGEKPYRCPSCGRHFSDSSSLARHRRIHARQEASVAARRTAAMTP